MDFGSKIKKYREINNISQETLADKIYVSRQTISNWENNKSYPDIKSLLLLCNIFNITTKEFFENNIDELKQIEESKLKEFNFLGNLFTTEFIILILSFYPLLKFLEIPGVIIWVMLLIITLSTSFYIEKLKKKYDIVTIKEIIAFCEKTTLTHDEKNIEFGKRSYQRFLLALCSGLITLLIIIIMHLLLG